ILKRSCRSHKPKVWCREAAKVRKHAAQVARIHAKPGGKRREVLIARRGRNPTAGAGVIRAAHGEDWEFSIRLTTLNCAPHDQVMISPAVVAALAIGGESSPKITAGKGSHSLFKIGIAM